VNNVNDDEDEFTASGVKCAEAGTEYFGNDLNVRRNGLRNFVSFFSFFIGLFLYVRNKCMLT
jgi:hypothetical protein